jgi:hypothetical protein
MHHRDVLGPFSENSSVSEFLQSDKFNIGFLASSMAVSLFHDWPDH